MINTLNIGKYIYSVLNGSEEITSLAKTYPLIADNDAKYPFIIYRRVNLSSNSSKDGYYEDDVTIEITVVSDKYSDSVDIATKIRNLLERQSVNYEDLEINDTTLSLATEEYSNNAYVQRLQFTSKINKN
jgi:hypothetical protein